MGKNNFFYFIKEGACNLFKHGFMSFAAIGITVACLLIMFLKGRLAMPSW